MAWRAGYQVDDGGLQRIRGGRGDALYKSTVDIDIDIDIIIREVSELGVTS